MAKLERLRSEIAMIAILVSMALLVSWITAVVATD
jgi:hypothetical protein